MKILVTEYFQIGRKCWKYGKISFTSLIKEKIRTDQLQQVKNAHAGLHQHRSINMEHKARNFFDLFIVRVLLGTSSRNSRLCDIFLIKSFYTALDAIWTQKERSTDERAWITHNPFSDFHLRLLKPDKINVKLWKS